MTERRLPIGGFTLVEVLVALAIVAFGLIAVFGQLNQSATAAIHLRNKTIAHWIAMNILTERRLLRQVQGLGTESDDIEMANTRWHYVVTYSETDTEGLQRADVTVAFADGDERPLATATGFLSEGAPVAVSGQAGSWRLSDPQTQRPGQHRPREAPEPAGDRQ